MDVQVRGVADALGVGYEVKHVTPRGLFAIAAPWGPVAPLERLLELFAKPMKQGAKLILYKGPEVENELAAVKKFRIKAEQLSRYELPDGMGTRVVLAIEAR